jgi:DNA-binding NtrC family response regulator
MPGKTIIISEAESDLGEYFGTVAGRRGFDTRFATDAADVVACLAETNGSTCLVLMDLNGDAAEQVNAVRRVRSANSRVQLVVLSSLNSRDGIRDLLDAGATDCLRKPVDHDQVTRVLRGLPDPGAAEAEPGDRPQAFFGNHPLIQLIRERLTTVARSDVPVVLRGESGVGKEVVARELHQRSDRARKPFLKINCAAVPFELLESELFGYERGAFTGAVKNTPGKFEAADGGTILLDEIGDMDFKLQAKLLHVLQDSEFQRLGGRETVRVNVRVIAATHCDLEKAMREGRFREDLYYRLNVVTVNIPPLRERKDEILPLFEILLEKHLRPGCPKPEITPALREALLNHAWPGNVRELENVARKLLVFDDAASIANELQQKTTLCAITSPPPASCNANNGVSVLEQLKQHRAEDEARAILHALEQTRWNRRQAARLLKVEYKVLIYRMSKLGIGAPKAPQPEAAKAATADALLM